ncbi:hypothetical protein [Loktanella salsilacus]|uniref:SecDF P1 head subdomain-containing protein n=1 Tax=Loktanella salsilacus TaxID=195913 RepID=UPI0037351B0E
MNVPNTSLLDIQNIGYIGWDIKEDLALNLRSIVTFLVIGLAQPSLAQDTSTTIVEIIGADGTALSFGVDDISDVRIGENRNLNQITYTASNDVGTSFNDLTMSNIGKKITISLCGEVVSSPIVQSMTFGNTMVLTGFTDSRAKEIGDILSGFRKCTNEQPDQ